MIQTVDPRKYILNFGDYQIVQYKKGTFITISYLSDAYESVVGVDGGVVRLKSADERAVVKIVLDQASPSNGDLFQLAKADRSDGSGAGKLQFKDMNGSTVAFAKNAWVKKVPDAPWGNDNQAREWEIECGRLVYHSLDGVPFK